VFSLARQEKSGLLPQAASDMRADVFASMLDIQYDFENRDSALEVFK